MSPIASTSSPSSSCSHCGGHVTDRFRRVYGDADDEAHRCFECDSASRIGEGSAAGLDVPTPDPQEHPGRSGGRWSA